MSQIALLEMYSHTIGVLMAFHDRYEKLDICRTPRQGDRAMHEVTITIGDLYDDMREIES